MDELSAAVDELESADLHALTDGELLARTAELVRARSRLDAQLARTVRMAELRQACEHDGLKTMASWLRGHARMSASAVGQLLRTGRALEHLPGLAAACAAGNVTAEQLAVVEPVTRDEHRAAAAAQDVDLLAVDAALADAAAGLPHADLRQVVQRHLDRLDPDGPQPDPTEQRSLTLARHPDGSLSLRGELDAVGGEKLAAALQSLLQAGRCAGDERTRGRMQADALVQLRDNALASGQLPILRTVKPHLRPRRVAGAVPHALPEVRAA